MSWIVAYTCVRMTRLTVAGLYLPDIPDASAQLLYRSEHIPEAWQGRVTNEVCQRGWDTRILLGKRGVGKMQLETYTAGGKPIYQCAAGGIFPTGHAGGVVQLATARSAVCYKTGSG